MAESFSSEAESMSGCAMFAVKHRRLTEYDIFLMNLVLPYQIFDALKPNQVDYPRTVRKVSYQPPLPSFTCRFKA